MKAIPKLDEKCTKIFAILLTRGELRFKDLKEVLTSKKINIPEPTLLMHLNHLTKLKLVSKTIKSAKNVTYKPNMERLKELQTKLDSATKKIREWKETEEAFLNKPIEEQIESIMVNSLMFELGFLKHQILFEKYGRFEDGFISELLGSYFFRYQEYLIIKKCLQNEDYMKSFLEHLESELKRIVGDSYEG